MRMAEAVLRPAGPDDHAACDALYREAFPDEDLLPLLAGLRRDAPGAEELVAVEGAAVIGHGAVTPCWLAGEAGTVALLGPLAVAAAARGRGIGRALVAEGATRMVAAGAVRMLVPGDPAYYGRLVFAPETRIAPLYPLPDTWRGAWQGMAIGPASGCPEARLTVPLAWAAESLWLP